LGSISPQIPPATAGTAQAHYPEASLVQKLATGEAAAVKAALAENDTGTTPACPAKIQKYVAGAAEPHATTVAKQA